MVELYYRNRKGYLHALEGMIAAIIVAFYLTSLLSAPQPTDWTQVHVSKQSEDILSALDQSGILETAVARSDEASLQATMNSLDSSLGYRIKTRDLPQSYLDVGVFSTKEDIYNFTTSSGSGVGGGGGGSTTTNVHRVSTQQDWNDGFFRGTSADRSDNSGILGIGSLNGTNPSATGLENGLVGYWRLDKTSGDVLDYSGNMNTGVIGGGTDLTRGTTGTFGTNAITFDGVTDTDTNVNVSNDPSLNPDSITVSAWIKPEGNNSIDHHQAFIGKKYNDQWAIGKAADTDTFRFHIQTDTGASDIENTYDYNTGQWYHVAFTYDASTNNWTHYVDSSIVHTEFMSSGNLNASSAPLQIGNDPQGDGLDANATIDEVRVYDRKLSDDEIQQLYFNEARSPPFEGNYTSETINTNDQQNWQELHVDASIPPNTDAVITFEALDSSGNVQDKEQFPLDACASNCSLSVSDSEDARWTIHGNSSDPTQTWTTSEVTVYYESGGGGNNPSEAGLPSSEHGYRHGNLSEESGFGDNPFVLSDTTFDGIHKYDTVNFDFNLNSEYDDSGEGPFQSGDFVTCDSGRGQYCDGNVYEVSFDNDTLILHNATLTRVLSQKLGETVLDQQNIVLDFESTDPENDDITRFDAVIAPWPITDIEDYSDSVEEFISSDKFFLIVTDTVTPSNVESTYLNNLGFKYENDYGLKGSGPSTNLLYSIHESGSESYESSNYYLKSPIRIGQMIDAGSYETGQITIREEAIGVRRYSDGTVSFETQSHATRHDIGSEINLNGNNYLIQSTDPLRFDPVRTQRFNSFNTTRITADYYATKSEHYTYNTSDYDEEKNVTTWYSTKQDSWGDIVESPCDPDTDPYRTGTLEVGGGTDFLLVNFDEEGLKGNPCSDYHEFVYFDKNGDGRFDQSGEGQFESGDTVTINGRDYTVRPFNDGNGTVIIADGPRTLGEIPISDNAVNGDGRVALINRDELGDDDLSIIKSLLLAETDQEFWFTSPRSSGDKSFSQTYMARAGKDNPEYYTLQTVWWYQ